MARVLGAAGVDGFRCCPDGLTLGQVICGARVQYHFFGRRVLFSASICQGHRCLKGRGFAQDLAA